MAQRGSEGDAEAKAAKGAATLAAFQLLRHQGWIGDHETVVLFNTGSGLKYTHLWA